MALATIASFPSIKFNTTHQNNSLIFLPKQHHSHRICKLRRIQCSGTGHNQQEESQQPQNNNNNNNNALLKVAWYGSELLGIAASALKPSSNEKAPQRLLESVDRDAVVDTIKQDFQRYQRLVEEACRRIEKIAREKGEDEIVIEKLNFVPYNAGDLTLNAYEDNCEFADPAGSFKGLQRFKRNCTNFGSLLEKSNMKLMKWEDFEDKGIGHWRFSCVLSFPWRPILSATGYTEYYFDPQSGKVCRHVEHWNVPKMALFKQILKPSRGFGLKDYMSRWLKAFQVKI